MSRSIGINFCTSFRTSVLKFWEICANLRNLRSFLPLVFVALYRGKCASHLRSERDVPIHRDYLCVKFLGILSAKSAPICGHPSSLFFVSFARFVVKILRSCGTHLRASAPLREIFTAFISWDLAPVLWLNRFSASSGPSLRYLCVRVLPHRRISYLQKIFKNPGGGPTSCVGPPPLSSAYES